MERLNEYKNNVKILYIEDDLDAAKKVKKILSVHYKNIVLTHNGEEALEIYRNSYLNNQTFDIVVSDINMPKVDGIELLERIREFDDSLPFIYVSANLDLDTLLRLVKLDIVNFIQKPIDIEELLRSINKVILNKYKFMFFKNNHIEEKVEVGDEVFFDLKSKALQINNEVCKLTKNEIQFIEILCKNQNSLVTTENIINHIWDDDYSESSVSNLKNLISRLRIKIPKLNIENVYGLGYKLKVTSGKY